MDEHAQHALKITRLWTQCGTQDSQHANTAKSVCSDAAKCRATRASEAALDHFKGANLALLLQAIDNL